MSHFVRLFSVVFGAVLLSVTASAQFYSEGTDAASVKWSSISTEDYRIIYPRGLDSLARVYAVALEKTKQPVGASLGFTPNQFYRKPMPVVLHTQTATANGMVTWTPRRMELYTVPEAYAPEAIPWERMLAIHESRHVAQMQLGRADCFKWANILFGETTPGAMSAIYGGPAFLEGDAVVAETALTNSGRGRSADFLEYFRASFSEGQSRNYWQWRYGSLNHYTPSYYAIGYLTNAGMRTMFDAPDFSAHFYGRIQEHRGWAFNNLQKTVKEVSGMKFNDAWAAVADSLKHIWDEESASRAPYTVAEQMTELQRYYTGYVSPVYVGGKIFALRNGITRNHSLVSISPDGKVHTEKNFSGTVSNLKASDDGRIFWSEYRADVRWEMRSTSSIWCYGGGASARKFIKGGRYFNPAPSPGTSKLSVTSYPEEGGSELVIFNAQSGEEISSMRLPDGWQLLESAWTQDGTLYFSALTDKGIGLWRAEDLAVVLEPLPVKIKQFGAEGNRLVFVCDKGGSNEIYSLDPVDGNLQQLTSTAIGASDWCFKDGELYFTQPAEGGRMLFKAASASGKAAFWGDIHDYPMASELSEGDEGNRVDETEDIAVSEPERYSKFSHLIHFHSWMPLYVDADAVSSISAESILSSAGLGATAFFQNELGSSDGYAGIRLTDDSLGWDPSLNLKFRYTGWYPVFELGLNAYAREAESTVATYTQEDNSMKMDRIGNGLPLMNATLKTYVPISTSVGGITRGIIPQINISLSTNKLAQIVYDLKQKDYTISFPNGVLNHRITASLRGYVLSSTPASCVFPKFGLGAEGGYCGRPMMGNLYCSDAYLSVYGYAPGFWPTHGLRLAARGQYRFNDGILCEPCLDMRPRGFVKQDLLYRIAGFPVSAMFSADYAMPFAALDWGGLGGIAYVRNLELRPFIDCLYCPQKGESYKTTGLFSAGAVFNVVLGNLLWIPYTTRVGVLFSYNGGSSFQSLKESGLEFNRTYVGLNFSIDM